MKDLIDVHLSRLVVLPELALACPRECGSEPWGFRLSGGKDQGQPLSISQVGEREVWSLLTPPAGGEGQPDPQGRPARQ